VPAHPTHHASLTRQLAPLFLDVIRSRGEDYVLRRRVQIYTWSTTTITAVARGTSDYQAILRRTAPDAAAARLSCSCPYYEETGPCKHMWAFARAIELDPRWDSLWNAPALDVDVDSVASEILNDDRAGAAREFGGRAAVDRKALPGARDRRAAFAPDIFAGGFRRPKDKLMSVSERRAISDRMKEYWAARNRTGGRSTKQSPQVPQLSRADLAALVELGKGAVAAGAAQPAKRAKAAKPKPDADDNATRAVLQRLERLKPQLQRDSSAYRPRRESASHEGFAAERIFIVDGPAALQHHQLLIHVARRSQLGPDEWSAPEPIRVLAADLVAIDNNDDRQLLALLVAVSAHQVLYGSYGASSATRLFGAEGAPLVVPEQYHAVVVPRLSATARLYLYDDADGGRYTHMQWDARPWTVSLDIGADDRPESTSYVMTGRLSRDPSADALDPSDSPGSISATAPSLVLNTGLVFHEARVSPVAGPGLSWLLDLRAHGKLRLPRRHIDQLLSKLLELHDRAPISVPDELRFEIVHPRPVPVLTLRPSRYVDGPFDATLTFDYDGEHVAHADDRAAVFQTNQRKLIVRDTEFETNAESELEEHGLTLQPEGPPGAVRIDVARKRVAALVGELAPLGWRIEVEGRPYRVARHTSIHVESGIDWFEIVGLVDFDGASMALPELLAAVKRGADTVVLADGSMGIVPDDWKALYGPLAAFAQTGRGGALRASTSQLSLVDALLMSKPAVSWDAQSQELRDRLRGFKRITPADAPQTFVGTLRGYQRDGLGWMRFLAELRLGGCLADDMGLGKTVMVLALLDSQRNDGPSLVVMPRSVLFNWRSEAARFTPQLRVLDYSGIDRNAYDNDQLAQAHLVLTTYGTLRRDAMRLAELQFNYVILDEAQAIKNAATVSAKAVRLLKARHRLALSGTPIENHVGELWSLFEFLNPGLLGSAEHGIVTRARACDADAFDTLRVGLRPYILRRTKAQVAPELPPRSEDTIVCELDAFERKNYEELRDHYRASILGLVDRQGVNRSRFQVLEALLRLRQAACHPGLIDLRRRNHASAKVEALVERLEEIVAEGHKALIFSQFTTLLALIKPVLLRRGIVFEYLDGKTRDRDARVSRFQTDPDCAAFLISLKAGGLGLNLTAAEYVFLLDPWWNPAVEAQAIDRAHRIGQDRPVFAYRLIAKDTVEERILELQARKRAVADAIITADNSALGELTRHDLELLLS